MTITYITEPGSLVKALPRLYAKEAWAIDTETTGLDPHKDKVILLQLGDETEQFVIDTRKVDIRPLYDLLTSETVKKVGHNLKFDYKMIKGTFGVDMECLRDSYLTEQALLNGKRFEGFGLDAVLERRLSVSMDKDLQKSFIGHKGDFSEAQIAYAAKDVQHLIPLYKQQSLEATVNSMGSTVALESAALPAFADMEFYGVKLDASKWASLMGEHARLAEEASLLLDEVAKYYVRVDLFGKPEINYSSSQQVMNILTRLNVKMPEYDRDTKQVKMVRVPKSDDKTLRRVKGVKFVEHLKEYRSMMMRVNTFGQSYIDEIHKATGRIHVNFNQVGTGTGRVAKGSGSVNLLNIPRDKSLRNSFIAEPGYVIETDDFSGCELRIWAEISKDPKLTEAFLKGVDVHCYVASRLYKKEVTKNNENAKLRTPAKALNFGIAYGMGAMRLYNELNAMGFPMTYDEARALFETYTKEFEVGYGFIKGCGSSATKEGYISNLNGRRRYWNLPDPEEFRLGKEDEEYRSRLASISREAGNFPIQSVNADITKLAMTNIRSHIKKNKVRSNIILQVYDEIVTETHKDDSAEFHKVKQQIMKDAAHKWLKEVPMEVDGHVGPSWTK